MTQWTSAEIADALLEERRVLRALARRLIGDADLADDAVAEAITADAAPPRSMRAFLASVVRRRAHNLRRDAARRARRERAAARTERVPSVDEMVARREVCQRVGDAVLRLDEPYRTTVWLRYFEGLPPRAIAARMRVPVATVRSRHARALAQLRGALDREFGDRRKWCVALWPWLGGGALSTALLGVGFVVRRITLVGVAVLGAVAVGLWILPVSAPSPPVAVPPPESARVETEMAAPAAVREPTKVAVPAKKAPAPIIARGQLQYDDGKPAAGLSFWFWGEDRPAWAQKEPSRDGRGFESDQLPKFDGVTDQRGRYGEIAPFAVKAVTFRVDTTIYVTYETRPGRDLRGVLPRLGVVTAQLDGWRPGDEWRVDLWAAVGEGFESLSSRVCATATGDQVVVTLRAPDYGVATREASVEMRAVAGVPYRLTHYQDLVEAEPESHTAWCGDTVRFRIRQRLSGFEVTLREPNGDPSKGAKGLVVHHGHDRRECGTSWLDGGRAVLRPRSNRPLVSVVTADGELFRTAAPIELAAGTPVRIDFERGRGTAAWRCVLPPGTALSDVAEVAIGDAAGRWDVAEIWEKQTFLDGSYDGTERTTWWPLPDGMLGFLRLDALQGRVRALLRDGNCAEATWRGVDARFAAPIPMQLLPSEALDPIDLRSLAEDRRMRRGRIGWVVRLAGERTDGMWHGHFVDVFEFRPWTREWPVWTKRRPSGATVEIFFWDFAEKSEYLSPPFTRRKHR